MKAILRSWTAGARGRLGAAVLVGFCLGLTGCANEPATTHSGFLSDYSRLEPISNERLRFESGRAEQYNRFIVEPVQSLMPGDKLSPSDRAEAIAHFDSSLVKAIENGGFSVTNAPGPRVARIRVALTDVAKSTWWKKVHPASRIAGAGTGGAAMEAELLDSVTGEQIAAVVQAGTGNQFNFTAFSTLADVKSAIDKWTATFTERLKEIKATR